MHLALWLILSSAFAGPPGLAPAPASSTPLSPALLEELRQNEELILATVRELDPDRLPSLMRLRDHNETAYLRQLLRLGQVLKRSRDDPTFLERVRRMKEHESRLGVLARAHAEADGKQQRVLRAEMEELAGALFELKQEERRGRVEELRGRLEDLQQEIEQREQKRGEVISDYVDQLLQGRVDL